MAIASALDLEVKACERGNLECGPCFMCKKGGVRSIDDAVRHEVLVMLIFFGPPKLNQRMVSKAIKEKFEEVITPHLERISVAMAHRMPRTVRPVGWVLNTQLHPDVDPEGVHFSRKGGADGDEMPVFDSNR